MLLLPGDPGFAETLATPPPNWGDAAARDGDSFVFIVRPGSGGVATAATLAELDDYVDSGEYQERLEEVEVEDETYWPDEPLIWTPN